VRPNSERYIPLSADDVVVTAGGIPIVHPYCRPGDALLFDELCLHANGGDQTGLTRHRYALEAWMFAPSAKPAAYLPILV
jgi:ectoine hydroxylase-related dioxygenase (phytanoyl-CoA dioxygenase family)